MQAAQSTRYDELKRLKEDFVSNLHGTTKWEVFCVLSCLPLCLLIAAYAEAWFQARARGSPKLLLRLAHIPKFVYEYGVVVVPQVLLLMSVAPAEPAFLLLFLLWGSLALKLWMKLAHGQAARQHMFYMLQHLSIPRKRYISAFRGGLMLSTCLAILAVDFPVFPRRFAKAEGYGAGVMDVGVGAIIWAGGLVDAATTAATANAEAAAVAAATGSKAAGASNSSSGSIATVWLRRPLKRLRAAVPLVLLGAVRLIATAAVSYQQHVGEYGLQWNFFWTIAAVILFTLVVPVPTVALGPAGLGLSLAHQALLSLDLGLTPAGSLNNWVQEEVSVADRVAAGFWVANKEGLGSLPGYWALYLLGAAVGHHLGSSWGQTNQQARAILLGGSKSSNAGGPVRTAAVVTECARCVWSWVGAWFVIDGAIWMLLVAAEQWVEPIQRRSCNLAYVLWITSQCVAWLLLCLMADLLTSGLSSGSSSSSAVPGGPPTQILVHNSSGTGKKQRALNPAAAAAGSKVPSSNASAVTRDTTAMKAAEAAHAQDQHALGSPHAAASTRRSSRPGRRRHSWSANLGADASGNAATSCDAAKAGIAVSIQAGTHETGCGSDSTAKQLAPARTKGGGGTALAALPDSSSPRWSSNSSSSSGSAASVVSGSSSAMTSASERQKRIQKHIDEQQAVQIVTAAAANSSISQGPMRLVLAFNRNMLALFLLGNVLTGAVNMAINTLAVGNWMARCILGLYMLLLCGLAVVLDRSGITIKA